MNSEAGRAVVNSDMSTLLRSLGLVGTKTSCLS